MINKFCALLLAVALFSPIVVSAVDAGVKIGFVNGTRLVEESPQAKAAAERMKKEFDPRQQALLDAQTQLRGREERFLKDSAFMSVTEKQNSEREIVSSQRELRLKQTELQEDFTIRRNQEMAKVWDVLRNTIQEFAKSEGFDLILFEGVSYASERVDVTDKILGSLK